MSEYINKKEFKDLLIEYKNTKSRKVYNKLGKFFLLIAVNVLNKANFINYTQDRKDEMISDATFYMSKYALTYDAEISSNPFWYFSKTAINSYKQYINKRKILNQRFISLSFIENFDNKDT